MRLAANAGRKKSLKSCHLRTIAQLCRAISSQLRHVSTVRKKTCKAAICPPEAQQYGYFGPLAAQIGLPVWGTPANFNGFRVLVALLARQSSSERQPNFAALNRGRHLCLAGRPSCWAFGPHSSCFSNAYSSIQSYISQEILCGCNCITLVL